MRCEFQSWPEHPPELPGEGAAEPSRGPNRVSRCVWGTLGHLWRPTGNRKWRWTPTFSAWRSISTFLCSDRQRTGTTGNPPVLQRTSERTWSPLWQEGGGGSFLWQLLYKNDENNEGISLKSFFIFIFVHICEYALPCVKRWNPHFCCCCRGHEAEKLLCMVESMREGEEEGRKRGGREGGVFIWLLKLGNYPQHTRTHTNTPSPAPPASQ